MRAALAVTAISCGACAGSSGETSVAPTPPASTARIVLVGDVMLGRSVADVVANDPDSVFESVRPILAGADLALGNLESPLTTRPHLGGGNALEAAPASAAVLAAAGFDAMSIANNHATDAGPQTVLDSAAALAGAGIAAVGGGADLTSATSPTVLDVGGVRIAVLAFDLTGGAAVATATSPGVAGWDEPAARAAVAAARAEADVVIVGVHGGIEMLTRPDPVLLDVVDLLTSWGVDIVWGEGAHVAYDVAVTEASTGRPSLQAPGLGNAVFDQRLPGTDEGVLLEVLVAADGVRAWRSAPIGTYLRVQRGAWALPAGDAVTVDGEWWNPVAPVGAAAPAPAVDVVDGLRDDALVVDARSGDVDGDGAADVVVAYRRPWEPRLLQSAVDPGGDPAALADTAGRSAHLAWFSGGRIRWGAGTLPQPVGALDVCDDGIALAFTTLDPPDSPSVVAGGAWWWREFGFATAPTLDGPAQPACADPDGDGRTSPALVRTSPPTAEGDAP